MTACLTQKINPCNTLIYEGILAANRNKPAAMDNESVAVDALLMCFVPAFGH